MPEPEVRDVPEAPVGDRVSRATEVPSDLPPPVVPPIAPEAPAAGRDADLAATGRMEPVEPTAEPELDPRELKALSRQERKEAKAALRREQQEARNAARQAKAQAKAAAKAERAAAEADAGVDADTGADEDVIAKIPEDVASDVPDVPEGDQAGAEAPESVTSEPEPSDPRARAAQRVQRRLGKDAEKLSAAEARARAKDEARRRRAQAKEQRSGVVAEEVVRPPEEPAERNLAEDVSVVEPEPADELLVDEPRADASVTTDEPVVEDMLDKPEPGLPKPLIGQRIDEPAPDDAGDPDSTAVEMLEGEPEPETQPEPEPVTDWKPEGTSSAGAAAQTREIPKPTPTTLPMDGEEEPKTRASMSTVAGIVGLIALGISVLLAVGALLVALGFDSGGLYEGLRTVANLLVGPLEGAFDFSGANAERKEHFLAWGAGSIGYLLISFVGQAVQRANDEG